MRFEQIIAAVTRRLYREGIRANTVVDGLVHATDLRLCMACVSPGMQVHLVPVQASVSASAQGAAGHASSPSSSSWQLTAAGPSGGKRKRLPLAARLLGNANATLASLLGRDK